MSTNVGLWIDHRKAVIVAVTDKGEEIGLIISKVEKQLRRSGDSPLKGPYEYQQVPAEDSRQRTFTGSFNIYYDAVIASIRDADSIEIFGPGEAKGELEKRIEQEGLKAHILAIETMDKMTDHQISAKVREHFSTKNVSEKTQPNYTNEKDKERNAKKDSEKKDLRGYHEQ